jgi:asparagine synthetase B (glutamine-hydrolysing)
LLINVKHFSLFLRDIIIHKNRFCWYKPVYEDYEKADQNLDLELIRSTLIEATRKRLMSDVPIGVLSGGLDSSLTSAIAARLLAEKKTTFFLSV